MVNICPSLSIPHPKQHAGLEIAGRGGGSRRRVNRARTVKDFVCACDVMWRGWILMNEHRKQRLWLLV